MNTDVPIEREWSMPDQWTFQVPPIGKLLDEEMDDGLWIDPFAGYSERADLTNDLNPDIDTDYTLKGMEFFEQFADEEVDGGVLLDPPYSPRQVKECYDRFGIETTKTDTQARFWGRIKSETARVCEKGAKAISFGWNSVGVSEQRGFRKKRILMVCHGGYHNDTICVVETKETRETYDSSSGISKKATEVNW